MLIIIRKTFPSNIIYIFFWKITVHYYTYDIQEYFGGNIFGVIKIFVPKFHIRLSILSRKNLEVNPLTARIFTVFGHSLLEDRALHKEAWVVKLLGTHLSIQVHKKVKFSWRDNSSLAVKGLNNKRNQLKIKGIKDLQLKTINQLWEY